MKQTRTRLMPINEKLKAELLLLKDENSKFITKSNGDMLLVDLDCDITSFKLREKNGYVTVSTRKNIDGVVRMISLPRTIYGLKDDSKMIDHINRNPLDNRRVNMRECVNGQNLCNRGKYSVNEYKYKGYQIRGNRVMIECQKDSRRIRYSVLNISEERAAEIYDCLALDMQGEFAGTNFPKENYSHYIVQSTLYHLREYRKSNEIPSLKITDLSIGLFLTNKRGIDAVVSELNIIKKPFTVELSPLTPNYTIKPHYGKGKSITLKSVTNWNYKLK